MYETAPIALFVYRRPEHTRRCIDALAQNVLANKSHLYVFSDGPKNQDASQGVEVVRSVLKEIRGFRRVTITERDRNLGLAHSIISGVASLVAEHGRVIVLEDDLVTSPYFLQYMNDGLDFWANREEVASIHGYLYPVPGPLPETFFLKGADCWGWATWKRAWDLFEPNGGKLLRELRERKAEREFDRGGYYPYTRMLEDQIEGKNDSWAIRWHASAFLAGRLTLFPGRSLVRNIGMDALATHTRGEDIYDSGLSETPIKVAPIPLNEDPQVLRALQRFFRGMRPSWQSRVAGKVKSLFGMNP